MAGLLLRVAVINRVEQKLESRMGLRAEGYFWSEQNEPALAQLPVRDGYAAVEILLAPRPSAVERLFPVEPDYGTNRRAIELEHGAVVEEDVDVVRHTVRQRIGVIDRGLQQRSGDVEFLRRQGALFAVGAFLDKAAVHGQSHLLAEPGRTSDGDDLAASLHEFFDLGQSLVGGDAAQAFAIFGRHVRRVLRRCAPA